MGGSILELNGLSESSPLNLFGIVGDPGSGKTTAMCTFPNIIVGDIDKKVPPGIPTIDFWDDDWVKVYMKDQNAYAKDAIKRWIRTEGPKIPEDYTFGLDSWTGLMSLFRVWALNNPTMFMNEQGKEDKRKYFQHLINYSLELMKYLKAMKCRVIITFHTYIERDKETSRPTGKIKGLMEGSFKDELLGHLGMCVRAVTVPDSNGIVNADGYRWQIRSSSIFNAMISPEFRFPETEGTDEKGKPKPLTTIKASHQELMKYAVNKPQLNTTNA